MPTVPKRSVFVLILTLFIAVFITACASAAETQQTSGAAGGDFFEPDFDEDMADEEFAPEEPAADGADFDIDEQNVVTDASGAVQQQRVIIRTGNIRMTADEPLEVREEIEQLVQGFAAEGAFIVSVNEFGGRGTEAPNITMVIRVPAQHFEETMDTIAELGVEIFDRNESAQDVTEEFVDLQARLESLEAARDRLLEIIEEAETTEALLQAEEQLTRREAEIESIKGRLQFLSESARLSSITVNIEPTRLSTPVDTRWRPGETVRDAFDNLLDSLRGFGNFLIRFTISVLPWLVLFGAVAYGVVRGVIGLVQRSQRNRGQPSSDDDPEFTTTP